MTLQRREGCHGVSVPRRSMGLLLNGGQARNLARQKTVSEKLQHWLSRSVSSTHSLPPPSTKHTLPPSQVSTEERQVERCRRLGRPTKASLLRMFSAPVPYVEPNYHEMVKKRKQFALHCKSASVPATLCNTLLPPGESLHSFLTGARYNSAHHVDTRSLDRLGLYIPRGDASRVFVNPAGTIPPSPAIYGLKRRARGHRVSDTHISAPSTHTTNLYGYTPTKYISDTQRVTVSIDQEIEQVFGPDQGSIGSDSVLGQCEEDSEGSCRQWSVEESEGGEGETEMEERAASSISVSKSFEEFQKFSDLEGSQGFDVVSLTMHSKEVESCTETESNISNSSTQVSINGTLKTVESESTKPVESFTRKFEMGYVTSQTSHETQNVDEPEPLDLISPTAQRMTDDILREGSSSSISSSKTATETTNQTLQNDIQSIDRGLQTSFVKAAPSPQSYGGISLAASNTNDRPSSATTSRPQSAGFQLASGRSSCIFVDLISLQTPQSDQD